MPVALCTAQWVGSIEVIIICTMVRHGMVAPFWCSWGMMKMVIIPTGALRPHELQMIRIPKGDVFRHTLAQIVTLCDVFRHIGMVAKCTTMGNALRINGLREVARPMHHVWRGNGPTNTRMTQSWQQFTSPKWC